MQVGGVFRNLRLKLVLLTFLLLICGAGGVKFRGVSARNGRYFCSVRVPGKNYVLWVGTYDTELEAARAYDVVAHYLGKNRREFNFYDYHPRLESVLAPFPSHLSFDIENRGAVTRFIARQAEGLLQVYQRRLLRSDDVQTVTVQHLQPGVHQMDQTPAHDEPLAHFDWTQVSPSHADLNHVLDFPSREIDSFDIDDQTFLQDAVFSSEVETLCNVQQSCQAENIVTEPNEGGFGGQILEQPGLQALIDHSWSLLPHTQMQPQVDDSAGLEQFLLSEPEGIMDVGNQNLVGQDLMMLDPCNDTTRPIRHDGTVDDLPMATDTSCPLCASKKIATHLLSYQLYDPVGLLKTIVALFQGLKEARMLDSTFDEGCEFPLCTTHQEETHGEGDESVREQANPTRDIALPPSNDDPLSGLTHNIFMYVSSTRIHPVMLLKFILVMLSVLPYLLVSLSHKKESESRGDMVVASPLPTQTGCSYRPNQYLPWQGSSSTTPGMHPRDQWRYVIDRSFSARGEIQRNIETWEISLLVQALDTRTKARHREAAVKGLINLSRVKELMGRFVEAEVIPSLLAVLRNYNENWVIREGSIITLFRLCTNDSDVSMKKVIVDFGGVPCVIHLLGDESINLSLEAKEKAFLTLAFLILETFDTIIKSSTTLDIAIPLLMKKLQQRISGLEAGVAACIAVLAQVPEYSCTFGSHGAIPILFESFKDGTVLEKKEALCALVILFNANKNKFNPCMAIPILVEELREVENEWYLVAVELLYNLLIEMEENFEAIEMSGAVPALVKLLHDGPPLCKIFAANKLIEISSKHEHVTDIVSSGALVPPLVTILQEGDTQEKESAALSLFELSMLHVEYHQVNHAMVDGHAVELLLDIVQKNVAPLVTAIAACILKLILPSAYAMENTDLSSIILHTTLRAMNDGNMVEKERVVNLFLRRLRKAELQCDATLIQEWTPIISLLVNMPLDENASAGNKVAAAIFIALSEQDHYRAFALTCGAVRTLKWLLQTGNSGEKEVAAVGLSFLFEHGEGMGEFVESDGITYMIDIIRKEVPRAKLFALVAIVHLSEVDAYKVVIRQWSSFFLSLFNTLIRDGAGDSIECVSSIVVNIFEGDKDTEDFEHSDAFTILLHELQHGAPNMREIAAKCLLRFTSVHELSASFGRSDVIPILVNILRTRGLKEKVNSAKILTMLYLEDVKFQISIATLGALPLFVELLRTAETPSDKNVASFFLYKFFQLGNGEKIIEGTESNIALNQIGDLPGQTPMSMEQFVQSKIEDIVMNHGVISALVNILGDENCKSQEIGACCLYELARIDKYQLFIGDCYAIPPLVELLWNGPSDSLTRMAAAITLFYLSHLSINRDRLNMFGTIPALTNLMVTGKVREKILAMYILLYFFTLNDTYLNEIIKVTLRNSTDAKNVLFDIIQNGDEEIFKQFAKELFNHVYIVGENNATTPILTLAPTSEV